MALAGLQLQLYSLFVNAFFVFFFFSFLFYSSFLLITFLLTKLNEKRAPRPDPRADSSFVAGATTVNDWILSFIFRYIPRWIENWSRR